MAHDDTVTGDSTGTTGTLERPADLDGAGVRSGPTGRNRSRWIVGAVVGVLAVALVAVSALATIVLLGQRGDDERRTQAIDTARDYAITMSSFDYQNLDANRDKIAGMSTEEFAQRYNEMVDALRGVVTDGQGKATATAEHVAVESLDDDHATVLVFADQQAVNVTAPQGNAQKYRMVLSLVRDGDRWIVDEVQTV
ncbi:mce associated protein mas1a [Rhodococcus sp. HNM0569]|uniref:mce associated protein mas1a n=1 Tax=Rhodococcus sp. HNM0569 TaxID=2716340 RepID=UPI00146BFB84|nr:mce associated protein mas1a [Rhodococcus sp. HNM0569]NLU81708.1 mce associated protein mas1a [Rhodococcus sp. HNM0569]